MGVVPDVLFGLHGAAGFPFDPRLVAADLLDRRRHPRVIRERVTAAICFAVIE
ncbi:MAG: hypothetical protein M3137_14670 [Actinomycetota bacterium]|nr:hypothetical protein [Actinomycetota bacterium]